MNDSMIGKRFVISGMTLEILLDDNDRWKTRNLTTDEIVFMKKAVLQQAIKRGKAEEVTDNKP